MKINANESKGSHGRSRSKKRDVSNRRSVQRAQKVSDLQDSYECITYWTTEGKNVDTVLSSDYYRP